MPKRKNLQVPLGCFSHALDPFGFGAWHKYYSIFIHFVLYFSLFLTVSLFFPHPFSLFTHNQNQSPLPHPTTATSSHYHYHKQPQTPTIDIAFCTHYYSGPSSPMMLNSKTQGWFWAQLNVKLTWEMLKWKI